MIRVGDNAPNFTLESVNLGIISLRDNKGKLVLIIFGRYFGCPACQLDFDKLLEYKDQIIKYANIIYFTQSSPKSAKNYIKGYEVDFPVVPVSKSDEYGIYRDYGVGRFGLGTTIEILRRANEARKVGKVHGPYEGRETQSPADFIVDEKGKIIWAHKGVLDVERILSFFEGY
jgi:peroxiredoxin